MRIYKELEEEFLDSTYVKCCRYTWSVEGLKKLVIIKQKVTKNVIQESIKTSDVLFYEKNVSLHF